MRAARLSLIGTTVALAVVNVALAALLVAERDRGQSAAEPRATLEDHGKKPQAASGSTPQRTVVADHAGSTASTAGAASPSSAAQPSPTTQPRSRTASLEAELRLLTEPAAREASIRQRKSWLREGYPNLVRELRLSPDESNALFEALAEQQVDDEAQAYRDEIAGRDGFHDRSALDAETRRRIAEILGEPRFARFLDYHDRLPDRHQIMDLGLRLGDADALGASEVAQLGDVMLEERERFTQEMRAFGSEVRFETGHPAWASLHVSDRAAQVKFYEDHIQRVSDHHARVRERAALILTPQQLERLNDLHEENVMSMRAYLLRTRSVDRQIEEDRANRASAAP